MDIETLEPPNDDHRWNTGNGGDGDDPFDPKPKPQSHHPVWTPDEPRSFV